MIQAWQKRLLNNRPVVLVEYRESGTYTETLQPADYEFVLIGQGGGAALGLSATDGTFSYARGGVGATLKVRISITQPTTITIKLALSQNTVSKQFSGVVSGWSGNPGGNTSITGIPGVVLIANGGSAGTFTPTNASGGTKVAGLQGLATVSGVRDVLINSNDSVITSTTGQIASGETKTATLQLNTNYPDNPEYGAGGDGGYNGRTVSARSGMAGLVQIKSV